VVAKVLDEFPSITANTYRDHPFAGWDNRSADFWGRGGRGDAIPRDTGFEVVEYLKKISDPPRIRHWIYLHRWWTDWEGMVKWPANDHSGVLRHVHITWY
jgi:hypothetical protein